MDHGCRGSIEAERRAIGGARKKRGIVGGARCKTSRARSRTGQTSRVKCGGLVSRGKVWWGMISGTGRCLRGQIREQRGKNQN